MGYLLSEADGIPGADTEPHCEARRESFILYDDFGDEGHIEILYSDIPKIRAYLDYLEARRVASFRDRQN